MPQLLLFPDPKPLVERLGADFFRQAPERPGVYLMRDAADEVVYVGKAKNLRKRLASYRVANPDRLRRRQLRLLRAVVRIELQECADETAALAREASLLRSVRPRFNRAGTWPSPPQFIGWRLTPAGLHVRVAESRPAGWAFHGPFGGAALPIRAALVRVLWCSIHNELGLVELPSGWFSGHYPQETVIPRGDASPAILEEAAGCLQALFAGEADNFFGWARARTASRNHPFEITVLEMDFEGIQNFAASLLERSVVATGRGIQTAE